MDLILVALLTIVIIPLSLYTSGPARVILGIILILFSPRYALTSVLFTFRNGLSALGRVSLCFGLSIVTASAAGLVLNYTTLGIIFGSVLITVCALTLFFIVLGLFRKLRIEKEDRYQIRLLPAAIHLPARKLDISLWLVLFVCALVSLGFVIHAFSTPTTGEKFTEFYLLDRNSDIFDFSPVLSEGEPFEVSLTVENHEYEPTPYKITGMINEATFYVKEGIELDHEEVWTENISFDVIEIGDDQEVRFSLFKDGKKEQYASVNIRFDVN
jgi:uncharacterized membrane protein